MKDISAHLNDSVSSKRSIKIEMSDFQKKIYYKAIDYLSRREHSARELKVKLQQKYDDPEEISNVITELINLDYLSEDRFRAATIRRYLKKGHSPQKIKHLLQNEQIEVSDQQIYEISIELGITNEQSINDLISKKLKNFSLIDDQTKILKKKRSVINYLLARGYEYGEISTPVEKAFKNLIN